MSVLLNVFIAIAAFSLGGIIGYCGVITVKKTKPMKDVVYCPVLSNPVFPKRISRREYNKRVDVCLREAVDKSVEVWFLKEIDPKRRSIANILYRMWRDKLDNVDYSRYNPEYQRLTIVARCVSDELNLDAIRFAAVWIEKS